jgi:hypothetical protein
MGNIFTLNWYSIANYPGAGGSIWLADRFEPEVIFNDTIVQ